MTDEPRFASLSEMSGPFPIFTILILVATVIASLRGFKDESLTEKLIFDPHPILTFKEYYRLMSSALLHLDVNHLFGNMLTLFLFGQSIEARFGSDVFMLIYLGSVFGGSLLSLWMHRHHDYRALGASGGVCGIMFAWILLFPGGTVMMFFIPIPIPGWIYAIAYLAYSFVAMKRGLGNVGHDAHLGGAITGLLLAAILWPQAVAAAPMLFLTILALGGLMFLYLWKNPLLLPLNHFLPESSKDKPKPAPRSHPDAADVDAVLDKVSKQGIQSLSKKERELLEAASKK